MLEKITQDELIPILERTGIKAKEYANPRSVGTPIEFFLTTIPGGKGILIKKGEKIGLKIACDKEHRQVVLSVHEGKRSISREVKVVLHDEYQTPSSERIETRAKTAFNMAIPGAIFTVSNVKRVKRPKNEAKTTYRYTAVVTASVTKVSTNKFLMGMDETSHFIAILPKGAKVGSVQDAHKFLKPHGVGAGSKRQGEFFFVPCTKDELKDIEDKEVRCSVPLENGSNHRAQYSIPTSNYTPRREYQASRGHAVFVKGLIFDKRAYRHAPVDLGDTWHKVVRNKEVNTQLNPSIRVRRYD